MSSSVRLLLIVCLLSVASAWQPASRSAADGSFKAGLAKVVITPEKPTWMAGYAARTKPSAGKLHDLFAKAMAIQDARGNRVVIVTTDLLGLPRALTSEISEHANKRYRLRREQILFNSSHTHTGPVVSSSLAGAYELTDEQNKAIAEYTWQLKHKLLDVIGLALKDLLPAKLSFGKGSAQFAMNRRELRDGKIVNGVNREGVVDKEVPVLKIESPDGKLRGVAFGYACHNTTLTGEFYDLSGDYAGFAQVALEKNHPDAMALFITGCGADINPYPRSKLEYAERHGADLAQSVNQVLASSLSPVSGQLKSVIGSVMISFAPLPSEEQWQARLNDGNVFVQRHAKRWLHRLERDGKIMSEYPYTIQLVQLGDVKLIALAGEVVTDYSLRLKKEFGGKTWVAGYSNDLCSYIASARMYSEGGYEVIESMIYYDLPGPYTPAIEETIIGKVHELNRQISKPTRR